MAVTDVYVLECECGRKLESRATEITCSCGRILVVQDWGVMPNEGWRSTSGQLSIAEVRKIILNGTPHRQRNHEGTAPAGVE